MARKFFLARPRIANPQILGLGQISEVCRKFVIINAQIANPQIFLVFQSANRKSSNFQGKRQSF
jgi:hypothetical protein